MTPIMSNPGFQVGLGLAVIPAAVTALIASSKIILVNIIADVAMRILTANLYTMEVYGVSFIAVPLLWKISLAAAIVGAGVMAVSVVADLAYSTYQRRRTALGS